MVNNEMTDRDILLKLYDHSSEMTDRMARFEERLDSVVDYQKQQNGRVFQLADRSSVLEKKMDSEVGNIKTELATKEATLKANHVWFAAIWAFVAGVLGAWMRSWF
jgi:hypothetical protein